MIKAAAGSYTLKKASSISPAAVSDNDLEAGPVTGDGASHYVLGKDSGGNLGFGLLANGKSLPATKAYIDASKFTSAPEFVYFDENGNSDITTAIESIEIVQKNVKNSEVYNLNGQRVSQPTKGLYIVNGKKVVVK